MLGIFGTTVMRQKGEPDGADGEIFEEGSGKPKRGLPGRIDFSIKETPNPCARSRLAGLAYYLSPRVASLRESFAASGATGLLWRGNSAGLSYTLTPTTERGMEKAPEAGSRYRQEQ